MHDAKYAAPRPTMHRRTMYTSACTRRTGLAMNQQPPLIDTSSNLIWIDLEMTGLDTVNDRIIEVATIVTLSAVETDGMIFFNSS